MSSELVSAVIARTADDMEDRQIMGPFQAGPQTWIALHAAASEMVSGPAAEAIRRHLGVSQVQFWQASRGEAIATLREVAGQASLSLAELQDADAHKRMDDARYKLAAALGYGGLEHGYTLGHLIADVASRLRQKDYEIEALRREQERSA